MPATIRQLKKGEKLHLELCRLRTLAWCAYQTPGGTRSAALAEGALRRAAHELTALSRAEDERTRRNAVGWARKGLRQAAALLGVSAGV